jgi:hypothetical protein
MQRQERILFLTIHKKSLWLKGSLHSSINANTTHPPNYLHTAQQVRQHQRDLHVHYYTFI